MLFTEYKWDKYWEALNFGFIIIYQFHSYGYTSLRDLSNNLQKIRDMFGNRIKNESVKSCESML